MSLEENLNLLSKNDLKNILKENNIENYIIGYIRLLGFVSNHCVFIIKR
ncbi:MAG: hypothetical protein LBV16_05490 [Elusimicrobiota bacterium]|nr:hypothetical protein [Elusimicrobiota bacterium]